MVCVCVCVCGEATKNIVGPKKSQCFLEFIPGKVGKSKLADNMTQSINGKMLIWLVVRK
jgi:hypothetical protein